MQDTRHDQAREILRANDRGGYTVPTARLYPFQWNWDSAFIALGWATFDTDRAFQELERLFQAQWPSGMVPHIVFWSNESTYFPGPDVWGTAVTPPTSGISQPPVAASIVRALAELDVDRAGALFEPLDRCHRWWHHVRDPDGSGAIAIAHPWESGRDNLPDWDQALAAVDSSRVGPYERRDLEAVDASMRPHQADYDRYMALVSFGAERGWHDEAFRSHSPFLVADPAITAILLRAERDLAALADRVGRDRSAIDTRIDRLSGGYEQFWNPTARAYCSFDPKTATMAPVATAASFLAPYAGVTDRLSQVIDLLATWDQHCRYLVPSYDPRGPHFEPKRYWRGPVWAVVNSMIATGLAEVGATDWSDRVRHSTCELIEKSGFAESFDPITGEPVGGENFSWTAAMWLTLAADPHNPTTSICD